jgi:hypothetical protein
MSSNSTDVVDYCKKILVLDSKIRFAGKIIDDELVSTARKDGVISLLDKDLAALAHH